MSIWCESSMVTDYMVELAYDEKGKAMDYRVGDGSEHSIELR